MSRFRKNIYNTHILIAGTLLCATPIFAEPVNSSKVVQQEVILKPVRIDKNGTLLLIRTTLIALDQANKTGLYTVLRDLGSPAFQINTAARLSDIFSNLRRDRIDLSATAVLEPQLTTMPGIDPNGLLQMEGFFPSVNEQIYFELAFAPVDGQWRLFGLSVRRGPSAPVAPVPSVAPNSVQDKSQSSPMQKK
jgi:hypothetical protein